MRQAFALLAALSLAAATLDAAPPPTPSNDEGPDTLTVVTPEVAGEDWSVLRVDGDMDAQITRRGDVYRNGDFSVTTPLPEGYPPPTPVGSVEIKRYPSVRRAEVVGRADSERGLGRASSAGFFPLFRHISRNDIAMTAPVEMEFRTDRDAAPAPDAPVSEWSMAFLYRTRDLHPTGRDEADPRVRIVDSEPVTVVSLGIRGDRQGYAALREHVGRLYDWIEMSGEWEIAGDPRTLGYNGPSVPRARQWWEVQVPVRPVESTTPDEAIASPAAQAPPDAPQ
jgi:hypothetical protein